MKQSLVKRNCNCVAPLKGEKYHRPRCDSWKNAPSDMRPVIENPNKLLTKVLPRLRNIRKWVAKCIPVKALPYSKNKPSQAQNHRPKPKEGSNRT